MLSFILGSFMLETRDYQNFLIPEEELLIKKR